MLAGDPSSGPPACTIGGSAVPVAAADASGVFADAGASVDAGAAPAGGEKGTDTGGGTA